MHEVDIRDPVSGNIYLLPWFRGGSIGSWRSPGVRILECFHKVPDDTNRLFIFCWFFSPKSKNKCPKNVWFLRMGQTKGLVIQNLGFFGENFSSAFLSHSSTQSHWFACYLWNTRMINNRHMKRKFSRNFYEKKESPTFSFNVRIHRYEQAGTLNNFWVKKVLFNQIRILNRDHWIWRKKACLFGKYPC